MKNVLITGSEGQLGSSIVEHFKATGEYKIYPVDKLKTKKETIELDITCEASVVDFFKSHRIDILINNAGKGVFTEMLNRSKTDFFDIVNINLWGTFLMTREFINSSIKEEQNTPKKVINIASIYGQISSDNRIYGNSGRNNSEIYCITKAGVIGLTKYCAANHSKHNISFNSISPGGIFNNQSSDFIENYSSKVPLGRMAKVEEIAEMVLLCAKANQYLNGEDIRVDGGMLIW